jgi:hypothetical protein
VTERGAVTREIGSADPLADRRHRDAARSEVS